MTDYRDRVVRAVLIPSDERVEIPPAQERTIGEWLKVAGIEWLTVVNMSSTLNMAGIMDDDAIRKGMPWNPRAHFLSGYPVDHPTLGDWVVGSLDWVDDGKDFVSIKPESEAFLMDKGKRGEEFSAWLAQPSARMYFNEYRHSFPQRG